MDVIFSKRADKDLGKLPPNVLASLRRWVLAVELKGIREVRRTPGYHDEPLHGNRKGQRSVRLNSGYRAIYCEKTNEVIEIIEVGNHDIY